MSSALAERLRERTVRRAEAAGLHPDPPPLPALLRGPRVRWLGLLVLLGAGQAGLAGLSAWALIRLGGAPPGLTRTAVTALALLVLAALAVGALRVHERVVAEKLGQHYVHQLRLTLVEDALTPGDRTSLGVTVARTTNDLTGVRTWISQGVAPLVVAVPLIAVSLAVLAAIDPRLALAVAVPVLLLVLVLALAARTALVRTRALRRSRGRLAARIADTVTAAEGILAAGGARRELRGVRAASRRVMEQAVDRAAAVGALRAAGVVAATLVTLLVAACGTLLALPTGTTVAAMAVAGLAAAPVLELGRIIEHRQSYRAARMVLGPALAAARERRDQAARRRGAAAALPPPAPGALVHVELPGLLPEQAPLRAGPGERIHLVSEDPGAPAALVRRLLELDPGPADAPPDRVWVNGTNLRAVPPQQVRVLVGRAEAGAVLERGSLRRALHYRRPDLDGAHDEEVLALVGLDAQRLPEGPATRLRRGGEPLERADRARLVLARALYGRPPLLIVDRLEADLDAPGRAMLERVLGGWPGTVLLVGSEGLAARLGAREHRIPPRPRAGGSVPAAEDGDGDGE